MKIVFTYTFLELFLWLVSPLAALVLGVVVCLVVLNAWKTEKP